MWPGIVIAALVLLSCTQSTQPEYTAERLTLEQLRTTPGFAWFDTEYQAYSPDTALVAQIRAAYVPGLHRFYVYVKPTCSCVGTQKLFPRFLRVLTDGGIRLNDCEIYAMRGAGDRHPHQNWLQIRQLPSFFIVRDVEVCGSILGELPPGKTIEQVVLEALHY
ncbi:MAG: hypothetical protein NZ473_01740 [Candidatus Kapabacteria bacterium]|nr:hypothetical protein [Candidatus Kapabacteria bacterium]MCS7170065.1 hypothetical protein [Candidatus Kapabacteria bacterium]MDW7996441.1 hypothetical protein [Bacteroidota bacterium]MDW8225302.1 hypothetical protein [Bacteroidota bacterium]